MKWFSGTVAGFFLGIIGLLVFIAFRAGFHLPVQVDVFTDTPFGPHKIIFKEVVGPYHEVAPHITEVEEFAKAHGIICARTFGYYLDNPSGVDHHRLRSHVGCLLESATDLTHLTQNPEFESHNYKVDEIKFNSYIMGAFDGSPALGAIKIYPKILKTALENHLILNDKAFEIYEVKSSSKVRTLVIFEILPSAG
ncbi:MAG: hypothetical protein M9899_06075 [Bdellovibrionaceae bacterium]|nr:hypothetical protein [Pseudobdellovibrionaceae bacterium]